MKKQRLAATWVALLVTGVAGCELSRSSHPTSPNIAGPIAGVAITAPTPVAPLTGTAVTAGGPAVALVINNASTTGVRPLSYTFQIGLDPDFASMVFSAEGVAPGEKGRTTVTVATGLEAGRTYHWRARALDGANTGPFSEVLQFTVVQPVVIQAPQPLDPIGGVRVTSRQPNLRTRNADRTGPAGAITYDFQVSTSEAFDVTLNLAQGEQATNTQVAVNVMLDVDRRYFWRVRAREASITGPWSAPQAFVTPLAVVAPPPPPPPPPPPTGGSGFPSDAEGTAMVAFVIDDLRARGISIQGDCGAFEVTKRVAWHFRNRGAGLERKTGGRRCEDASIDIVLFDDGRSVDILIGGGVDNGPAWQVHPPYSGWQAYWFPPYNPDGAPSASKH